MISPIVEALTNGLSAIAWKIAGVTLLVGVAAIAWKALEKKILSIAADKAYERKQRKLDELTASKEPKIERTGPTYEEWKAAKAAGKKKDDSTT